jgi:hypothetical protein
MERAYLELCAEKTIQPFKGNMQEKLAAESASVPAEVVAYIERAPVRELKHRYQTDKIFRKHYDTFAASVSEQPINVPTTVAEYHQIPARIIAKRYASEPRFRAAVDSLISRGLI